jgi:prepilin-type N-terminal cleavage/methylation domain-containing protein
MKNSNKGFTLIEILVAMSIVMLIAMAFFSINNMSIKLNSKNEKDIQSMNIAQSIMEDIRQDIKEGKDGSYFDKIVWANGLQGEYNKEDIEIDNNKYNVNIAIYKNEANSRLYTVIVDVSALNATNKNARLITQIFEK